MAKTQKSGAKPTENLTGANTPPALNMENIENKGIAAAFFSNFKWQVIVLSALGLIFYFNSFFNEFALDDRPIIIKNEYVQQGISGIPKIMTVDAFDSYLRQQNSGNVLSGGRYRPLSIVTFAIEQQFLGTKSPVDAKETGTELKSHDLISPEEMEKYVSDMHVRHVINVLLYILSVVIMLQFLRTIIFPKFPAIAFIASLLFLIHPLHTEVVANVKSRDEILSMLFICLTFIYSFRYKDDNKKGSLYKALGCYLLALLSKEYAVTLIVLLPLSFYLFRKETLIQGFTSFLPFLAPLAIYILLRLSAVSGGGELVATDVLNIPYLYATPVQKVASIIGILFKYLELLVFPHPLSSDYSYNQIPYIDFSSIKFWISLVFYVGVGAMLLKLFKQRHVLTFAISFYIVNLLLIGNVFVNIGAPMGERLIYHSSLGFAMVIAFLLYQLALKIKPQNMGMGVISALLVLIIIGSGFTTINRNKSWKNDKTLFLTDVENSPNSVLILGNAGSACIDYGDDTKDSVVKMDWYRKGIKFFDKAIAIDPLFTNGYQNRGVCYYQTGNADHALADWDSVKKYYPNHPSLPYLYSVVSNYYYKQGIEHGKAGEHDQAVISFQKAASATPMAPDVWYNLGFANLSAGHYKEAMVAFDRCLKLKPGNARAREYFEEAKRKMQP